MPHVPTAVHTVVGAASPLLLQLQNCGRLLWAGATATAAAEELHSREAVQSRYCRAQLLVGDPVHQLCSMLLQEQLDTTTAAQAVSLVREPAVAELLLQLLTVYTMLLHQQHSEQQQQHPSKQHRADLLPIPAFHQHQDMLQLLPGGQAYLDTAGEEAAACAASECALEFGQRCGLRARIFSAALQVSLRHSCIPQQGNSTVSLRQCDAPVLSAAAVRLVLELQLLAAGAVQCLQQQQHGDNNLLNLSLKCLHRLLLATNALLQRQIKAMLQVESSCLPPEVLQQAGLQLLQALAALLQQLQLTAGEGHWGANAEELAASSASHGVLAHRIFCEQLLALTAAAPGTPFSELAQANTGEALQLCQADRFLDMPVEPVLERLPKQVACLFACLFACFLAFLLSCFLASLLPCFLASLLPRFLARLLACLLGWLAGWLAAGLHCSWQASHSSGCLPELSEFLCMPA
jgi:hypothetical protein